MPIDLRLDPSETILLTDLYELTMAASYFEHGFNDTACFSLAVRRLPPTRSYLVAAGLERLLEILENFHFDTSALEYLDSLKLFKPDFLHFLSTLRFTGEVWAMPEGTIFFAEEPLLEVRAPLIEAQLLETIAINQLGMASLIASKAARCLSVARGRRLVEFGMRRAQGADAALIAARSTYLAGFDGTSDVLAGKRYGIPLYGTMAHSYIMAHDHERDAFAHFATTFPRLSTLLVDTYDTIAGVRNAVAVALELKDKGFQLVGIRLDSGDLLDLSRRARRILDEAGLREVAIFASGNLNENKIDTLLKAGAPVDAFGVGTELAVSADACALDIAYKMVEYKGIPRLKTSQGKLSLPGRKQVFRASNSAGAMSSDIIGLCEESADTITREFKAAPGKITSLLTSHLKDGQRQLPRPSLAESRERFVESLARLEHAYKSLDRPDTYPVRNSAALKAMIIGEKLRAETRQG
ncbi:MAG TPA: nicotinate phosphoribosyltransferase [Candidatus Binataceae bacterium]|nr:nicotinate phosphoribosyltransferase [Candidatus Binataceae bacterium]